MRSTRLGFQLLLLGLVGLNVRPAVAEDTNENRPLIAPINARPEGQTYGRWAVEYWQWALGVPAATNPVLDTTGKDCAQRQVDTVWFLAGSFATDPVVRSCEIPAAKSLFIPLINILQGAFLNDKPEERTEEFVREHGSCTEPAHILVWIDGVKVPNPVRFFTGSSGSQSPFFNVQLPPDNVFGVDASQTPELVLSPSAEQGYYLFVRSLSPGSHTIRWIASGCVPKLSQDITYNLTIKPSRDKWDDRPEASPSNFSVPPYHGLPTPDRGQPH